MIVDYDPPIKKLAEEFIPHSKVGVNFYLMLPTLATAPPSHIMSYWFSGYPGKLIRNEQ